MKKIVAIVATVLFIMVGDAETINYIALSWKQLIVILTVGLAILILWLGITAEP